MARYIDRDKLIKLVKEQVEDEDDIEDIIYLINEIPTEEVTPIIRGKWHINKYNVYVCSNCGKVSILKTPYCGYCCAKMEESGEGQ